MEPVTILPYYRGGLSSKVRFALFVATFGTLWLFIEPLTSFGFFRSSSILIGTITYAVMLIISIFSIRVVLWFRYRQYESRLQFLTFTVLSASDGYSHVVRSPVNMQVRDFTRRFLNYLSEGPGAERVNQLRWGYEPILQICKKGKNFYDVENSITLCQAGIVDGSVCQIRAKPIPKERILFSKVRNENSNK